MKRKSDLIIVIFFIVFIYGLTISNFFVADKEFSEMENRNLAQCPQLSLAAIGTGQYMEDFETYFTDQFAARDVFVNIKSLSEKVMGKKINNGIYFAEEGYLIEQLTDVNDVLLDRNVEAIRTFVDSTEAKVAFAMIPGSIEINRDKLFKALPDLNQKSIIDEIYRSMEDRGIPCVDVYSYLQQHSDEDIFYRTDHHWTSLGAYYGYRAYADTIGFTPVELDSYEEVVQSKDFLGTLYSKAGAFWIEPDSIVTYVEDNTITVDKIEGETIQQGQLYDKSKLSGKDKYSMFLGGNQPLAIIRNGKDDQPKLLVIRDSYSDSMAPFLTEHFSEIHMWDFRYNKESVSDYIEDNAIEHVLICYSLDNFQEDTNIAFVLGRE